MAVRNRGTQDLRDAVVMLYWADESGALAFPMDWKMDGFFNGPAPTDVSNHLEVPPVPPGGVVVLDPLRFLPPPPESAGLGNGAFVLGARLVQPFDVALSAAGQDAVRASNNVAIHPISVVRGSVSPTTLTFHINSCNLEAIQRETVKIMNTSATAFEVSISLDNKGIYPNWHKFGVCGTGASKCTDAKLEKQTVPPNVGGNNGELEFSVAYKPGAYGSDHTTALNFQSTFTITPVPITGSFDRADLDCVDSHQVDICKINPNFCFLQKICWLCPIWEDPLAWIINPLIIVSLIFLPVFVWGVGRYFGETYQTTWVRRIVAATGFATVAVGGMIGAGILITATAFAVVGALRK